MDEIVLSYSELAERLGIKLDSARKLARRKKWPKTVGNDGLAKLRIPTDELPESHTGKTVPVDIPEDEPDDVPTDRLAGLVTDPMLFVRIEGLERLVTSLEDRVTATEADRDSWRRLAERSWWERIFGKK